MIRSYFRREIPCEVIGLKAFSVTTIAPNTMNGKTTLTEEGWVFVTEDHDGNIISTKNADEERKRILRGFGHKV